MINSETSVAAKRNFGGPKGLAEWKKQMQNNLKRLKDGEISLKQYESMSKAHRPRPISLIRQNIRKVSNLSQSKQTSEGNSTQTSPKI